MTTSTPAPSVNPAPLPHAERLALYIIARLALADLLPADALHATGNSADALLAVVAGAIHEALPLMGDGWLKDLDW
jgi:hypothetical protein